MRSLFLIAIAGALLAAPTVAAQATLTVTIDEPPEAFPELRSNSTASVSLTVTVTMSGVSCAQATTIPVTLALAPGTPPAFFTVAADPEEATINVPVGAYPGEPTGALPVGGAFTGSTQISVVATTTEVTDNATVPVAITATARPPAGCQPEGGTEATSAPVTVTAMMVAPPPPPEPEPVPEERSLLPAPGVLAATLAALAAVAIRRVRRE